MKKKIYKVKSSKKDGSFYEVTNDNDIWSCTCLGYVFGKDCRHITETKSKHKSKIPDWYSKLRNGTRMRYLGYTKQEYIIACVDNKYCLIDLKNGYPAYGEVYKTIDALRQDLVTNSPNMWEIIS